MLIGRMRKRKSLVRKNIDGRNILSGKVDNTGIEKIQEYQKEDDQQDCVKMKECLLTIPGLT